MEVRTIKPEDLDSTLDIVEEYFSDLADYNPDDAVETVKTYTAQYHYTWQTAYIDSTPVGFVGGYIMAAPWNEQKLTGYITMIYLVEEHSTVINYETLIDYFTRWTSELGGTRVSFIAVEPELQNNFNRFDASERRID